VCSRIVAVRSSEGKSPKTLDKKVRIGTRTLDDGAIKLSMLFVQLKAPRQISWQANRIAKPILCQTCNVQCRREWKDG
jgi:hypothetical protein